jgi:hypothetical protein
MYDSFEAFSADALACGSAHYPDASLDPRMIEAAYRIYRNAAGGTKLANLEGAAVDFGVTIVGRLARRADGRWVPADESFPSIDEIMRENLGELGEDGSGAILDAAHWSLLANDAWLLGGMHARTEFHFASPLRWENLWDEARGRMTVTAREVIGIVTFGYRIEQTPLEPAAACVDAARAVAASLPAYRRAVQAVRTGADLRRVLGTIAEGARGTARR